LDVATGESPPRNTPLLENRSLFDPSLSPFTYSPVSCHPTASDVVVPKLGEATEDKCLKKQKTERKTK